MRNCVVVIFILITFLCKSSYSYVNTANDYYTQELEPKLDILCNATIKEAKKIIQTHKPIFEITLTQEERYFSADSMEFFTGEIEQSATYSKVKS